MSTYSGYDDEPRRYRNVRVRPRERDEPDYVREETYIERGKGSGPRGAELVYRGRDDSIEDIPRDFPPPGRGSRRSAYDYDDPPRRSKSTGGRRGYDDDDRYTDYGDRSVADSRYDRRGGSRRDDRDYDSEYSRSPSPRRNRKSSNSGGIGDILKSIGAGGIVGGLLGNKDKDKGRDRSRSRSRGGRSARSRSRGARSRRDYSSSRSRSRGGNNNERKWAQAAQAALVAGAVEAFRSRKEPGPWTGEKGKRIATAALGAGGIDGLMQDRNPDEKSKRHLATAVLGGMAASRLANGSRANSRDREDRSEYSPERRPRSRSRSVIDRLRGRSKSRGRPASPDGGGGGNGAVKGLLGAGAIAAAGKALYNKARSKSRKRRSPSNSSADSYVPSRTRRRDRRRSPRSDTGDTRRTDAASVRGGQDGQDDRALARGTNRNRNTAMVAGASAANRGGGGNENENKNKDGNDSSDSSSTTDMEKKRRHMRGKEIVTASLATVATIHAAHGVYSSMEAHEKRHKLVAEGEMSPEEARKKQTKAWIQDAAAVGIAALGIKGAFSEWKQMNEQRRSVQEMERRKTMRRKKRERRDKQEERDRVERMMQAIEKNPQLAIGHQLSQGYKPSLPQADLSGNPYAPLEGRQRY